MIFSAIRSDDLHPYHRQIGACRRFTEFLSKPFAIIAINPDKASSSVPRRTRGTAPGIFVIWIQKFWGLVGGETPMMHQPDKVAAFARLLQVPQIHAGDRTPGPPPVCRCPCVVHFPVQALGRYSQNRKQHDVFIERVYKHSVTFGVRRYVVIATKPVHRLQIRPTVQN